MTGTPRIRGRINSALNGLVQARTIVGFRTNLYSRALQDDIIITITAISAAEACSGLDAVQEALMPLAIHAKIRFEVP